MRALIFTAILATASGAADDVTWLSDYPAGRKEAVDGKKAVCLVIGSDNCFYCRKLESTTLTDTGVTTALKANYICIKVDGKKEVEIVKALKVQLYPTTVLASADGTIHAILNGFVSAEQMKDNLKKTLVSIADDDRMERDVAAAKAALEAGDVAKASALVRPLLTEFKSRPAQMQAKELLETIDRAASARAVVQAVRPQALLDVAKQLHDNHRYTDAMDVAAEVVRSHPQTNEAKAAVALIEEVRTNPEKLRSASRQADEKAAALQLALSESHLKKGESDLAKECLDQVLRLCPSGPHAEAAIMHLAKLKGPLQATPANLRK